MKNSPLSLNSSIDARHLLRVGVSSLSREHVGHTSLGKVLGVANLDGWVAHDKTLGAIGLSSQDEHDCVDFLASNASVCLLHHSDLTSLALEAHDSSLVPTVHTDEGLDAVATNTEVINCGLRL